MSSLASESLCCFPSVAVHTASDRKLTGNPGNKTTHSVLNVNQNSSCLYMSTANFYFYFYFYFLYFYFIFFAAGTCI